MASVHFLRAQRCDKQQWSVLPKMQQEVQPFQRLPVAPLDIVEQQEERFMPANHSARECLEHMLALPVLRQRVWTAQLRSLFQQVGQQPCDFSEPDLAERSERRS